MSFKKFTIFALGLLGVAFLALASTSAQAEELLDSAGNSCAGTMLPYYEVLKAYNEVHVTTRLVAPSRYTNCCGVGPKNFGADSREVSYKTTTSGDFNVDGGFKSVTASLKASLSSEDSSTLKTDLPAFSLPKRTYGRHGFAFYQDYYAESVDIRQLYCAYHLAGDTWESDTSNPRKTENRSITQTHFEGENDGPYACEKL